MTERILAMHRDGKVIGKRSRDEVHEKGYWHETFHCWIVAEGRLHFQKRSRNKKDYPGLYDITAAGHLLADESVEDGLREVEEELGLVFSLGELIDEGIIPCEMVQPGMIDRERCHVYIAQCGHDVWDQYALQKEEVAGVVAADLQEAIAFLKGETDELMVEGFEITEDGRKLPLRHRAGRADFVGHDAGYSGAVAKSLTMLLQK